MCRRQHFARSEWVRRESNPHQPGKNRRRSPLRHEPEQPHPSESNRDLPPFKRTRRPHTREWDPGASANAPASMSLFGCQRPALPTMPSTAVASCDAHRSAWFRTQESNPVPAGQGRVSCQLDPSGASRGHTNGVRIPFECASMPWNEKSRRGFPGRLLCEISTTRSYAKGALPPGLPALSSKQPRANESLVQDRSMVLVHKGVCAGCFLIRMVIARFEWQRRLYESSAIRQVANRAAGG